MQDGLSITARARRAQIVDAAVRVIAREGLSKASFGRIAAVAGLSSPGMISYHFTGKDELLTVLSDTVLDDFATAIATAVDAAEGPGAKLAAYVRTFVGWQDDHRDEVNALWRLASGWKRPGQPAAFDETPLREPVSRVLRDGQAAGLLRPVRVEWAAHAILCAVEGYQQARNEDPDLDAESYASTLVDLFERGLIAEHGDSGAVGRPPE